MLIDLALLAVGLVGLYLGAEWLIAGAVRVATALGVSSFVVGLTLVSIGTSAPELVVSGLASYGGNGALALGNVLGSNVANVSLILGVAAVIAPIQVRRPLIARDLPVLLGTALLIPVVGWSGDISRIEGLWLIVVFAAYMAAVVRGARRDAVEPPPADATELPAEPVGTLLADAGVVLLGLVVLAAGAQLLVASAVDLARALSVPEVVVGLTLVALGTSLPELAASVNAARRGEGDLVLGNIIGSNIFNSSLILGSAASVRPVPVEGSVLALDGAIVVGLGVLLVPIVVTRMRVDRWEGALLLAAYAAYLFWRGS